jgi:hypothetical protein
MQGEWRINPPHGGVGNKNNISDEMEALDWMNQQRKG